MKVVVRQMREIRALGADLSRRVHRLGKAQVGRMIGAEQRVDHQHASRREAPPTASAGIALRVGDVRESADAIGKNRDMAVRHDHRVTSPGRLPMVTGTPGCEDLRSPFGLASCPASGRIDSSKMYGNRSARSRRASARDRTSSAARRDAS